MAANERLDASIHFDVKGLDDIGNASKELKGLGKAGSEAEPGLKKATESTGGLGGAVKGLVAGGLLAAAGNALLSFGKQAITAASDVQEMQSKFDTVFKDLSGSVTADLQAFADAANRSVFDLQGFAATLQDTFVPLGFARDEAANMSIELVKLAEDLASFNNLNTADVVNDLQSALVGNTETLRKYGVVANQAAIDQKALELGLEFTKGQMDAQTKSAAILALTLESTTDAQGDAIKTADSYANVSKGLDSAVSELSVAIGQNLLPLMTALKQASTENVGSAAQYVKAINEIKGAMDSGNISYFEAVKQAAALNFTAKTGADVLEEYAKAEEEAAKAAERFLNSLQPIITATEKADAVMLGQNEAISAATQETLDLIDAQSELGKQYQFSIAVANDYASAGEETVVTLDDLAAAEDRRTAALEESERAQKAAAAAAAALAAASGRVFVDALDNSSEAIGFFNENLSQMSDSQAYISNLPGEQNSTLSDLQGEYEKAAETLASYDYGVKSVGLSEEDRAEKMAETAEQMANLQAAMDPLISAGGEYADVQGRMTVNQDAINKAIFDNISASGASAESLAILGGALGLYSDEAVNAALQTALIQSKIDELAAGWDGTAEGAQALQEKVSEYAAQLAELNQTGGVESTNELTSGLEGTAEATTAVKDEMLSYTENLTAAGEQSAITNEKGIELKGTLQDTDDTTKNLITTMADLKARMEDISTEAYSVIEAIGAIPKENEITFSITTNGTVPQVPGGGGTGSAGPGYASGTGGEFLTVPPHYPNDSYNIGLSSGERYMVIPAGGGDTTNNTSNTLTANINVGSPREYVDPLKRALRETGVRGF